MARYVAGDSVLRLDGRTEQPIQPGETFDYEFSETQEVTLLRSGAIRKADPPAAPMRAAVSRESSAGSTGAADKE